jgi:hypothetical protein
LHSVNQAHFLGLIAEIEQIQTDVRSSCEYGMEELGKALKILRGEA